MNNDKVEWAVKRLKNAKDEDNCCAEADAGEGDDRKGEKGLMVIMEDNCNHSCANVQWWER